MRKAIFMFLCIATTLLAACSNDDGEEQKKIQVNNEKELNQTLYADQLKGGISFVAEDDWTTVVTDNTVTRSAVSWITLDPDHGAKGSYTVSINLEPNLTGKKRTATITIVCGDTKITVTITQEGTTESGEVPEVGGKRYLVSRIDCVHEMVVASTGVKYTDFEIYTYEYDDQNRVIRMQEEETLSSGVAEISGNTFTYKDNIILMQSFSNDESDEYDEATLTLGADGNISVYEINEFEKDNSRSWYTAGSLSYNEEGYVIRADMKVEASNGEIESQVDLATWENGNMVKVYDDAYGVDHEKTVTIMSYDNPAYVNNTNINLDLNYLICDSEWLDCWAFSGSYIKHYGFMGKRSKNYMTKEYDGYNQEYCTYTYDFNDEGLPVKIVKTRHERSDYFSKSVVTYTITYSTPVK